ncbi:MAG: peptidyl-prolyl cis-trans isomerase [Solirubrobacteraceae bacterium]
MHTPRRLLLALSAFLLGLGLAACGGVPGNSVAKVGGETITKDQFNHWLGVAAKANSQSTPGQAAVVPDAPTFKNCIANLVKTTPKPAQGQPKPSTVLFKQQCQTQYDGLKNQVLQFLIQSQWVTGEAKDQGVTVSDADVQKSFQAAKKQNFKTEADFQKFLTTNGQSLQDILFRFRLDLTRKKLTDKITKGKSTVTPAQITAYYNSHKAQFGQPERRDLQVVLTKTKARADAAKKALEGGASFKEVAKKYSVDQQSKATGGLLKGAIRGQQDQGLDKVAFSAPKGKLQGPVKAQFGFYLVDVKKITPASQQPQTAVEAQIKQQLTSTGAQTALTKFQKIFEKKWVAKTDCRKGFLVPGVCKNAPKKPATPGVGQQQAPQQGAPQQVPQQGGAQQVPQQGAPQQVPQQGAPQQVPQQAPPTAP